MKGDRELLDGEIHQVTWKPKLINERYRLKVLSRFIGIWRRCRFIITVRVPTEENNIFVVRT